MVSTRQQKRSFPSPPRTRTPSPPRTPTTTTNKFIHTSSTAMILWLIFSIPLVLWDSGYVLLRPHSMPGNSLHSPLWTPYALYGTIDYIYGWPAFNARNGFTAAQTVVNLFESAGYCYYLWVVWRYGVSAAGAGEKGKKVERGVWRVLTDERLVSGRVGATALLIAYSASVMTLGKTVLYWLNETFSGFENIGHNDLFTLIFLWIIPNGLWIIFPSYNIYVLGSEIAASLENASVKGKQSKSS